MAGMQRKTRIFLKQVAIICIGLMLTRLIRDHFGWTGVLVFLPIAFAIGFYWPMAWRKWEERGAIK
jgi:hypothetical protein